MINYKEKINKCKSLINDIPDFIKNELFDRLPETYEKIIGITLSRYPRGVIIGTSYNNCKTAVCPHCKKVVNAIYENYKNICQHCEKEMSSCSMIKDLSLSYTIFSDDSRLSEPAFFQLILTFNFIDDIDINIYEVSHTKGNIGSIISGCKHNVDDKMKNKVVDEIINAFKKCYKYSGFDDYIASIRYSNPVENLIYCVFYIKYPHVELLLKTKYRNAIANFINNLSPASEKIFKRNFTEGKNLKEILVVPEWVFPENFSLEEMNEARIIYNKYNPTKEAYETFCQFRFSLSEVKTFKQILAMKYEGKELYTFDKLILYLGRCDMYQAIYPRDAVIILRDYLNMTINSDVMPDVNSNSLKREHDISVRNYKLVVDKIIEDKFITKAKSLAKYAYEDKQFIVTIPKIPQDLINEEKNNRNCVGSYVSSFAEGRSKIFFIRYKDKPEESYVTLEIRGPQVTQAYLSSNRQISDKKTLEFIEQWQSHLKSKKII